MCFLQYKSVWNNKHTRLSNTSVFTGARGHYSRSNTSVFTGARGHYSCLYWGQGNPPVAASCHISHLEGAALVVHVDVVHHVGPGGGAGNRVGLAQCGTNIINLDK